MSSPSREHLLGYLLGALSPDEHEQVETEINQNPALQAEMQRLKACVENVGLADERPAFDPPAGLAERTCRFVADACAACFSADAAGYQDRMSSASGDSRGPIL